MPEVRPVIVTFIVVISACSGGGDATSQADLVGAESPVEAVQDLQRLVDEGEFEEASSLAVPGQAALASLAEGATLSEVARALEGGDAEVAANFWSGFAQGAGDSLAANATVESHGSVTESGTEFFLVGITPDAGSERLIATQDMGGHRIDLFASFGPALADRMIPRVETILDSTTEDADLVLRHLRDVVPSLTVAASDESLSPQAVQEILQLIEIITRIG